MNISEIFRDARRIVDFSKSVRSQGPYLMHPKVYLITNIKGVTTLDFKSVSSEGDYVHVELILKSAYYIDFVRDKILNGDKNETTPHNLLANLSNHYLGIEQYIEDSKEFKEGTL